MKKISRSALTAEILPARSNPAGAHTRRKHDALRACVCVCVRMTQYAARLPDLGERGTTQPKRKHNSIVDFRTGAAKTSYDDKNYLSLP